MLFCEEIFCAHTAPTSRVISLLIVVLEGKCVSVVNLRLVKKHVGEFSSCIIPLSDHHLVKKLDQLDVGMVFCITCVKVKFVNFI